MRINIERLKDKKIIGGVAAVVFLLILILVISSFGSNRPDQDINLPARGNLLPLNEVMKKNRQLRMSVEKLLAYEPAILFVNYRDVNATVADILFLWIGLTPDQVNKSGGQSAVEMFLRRVHSLPNDEPVQNNPFIGVNAWSDVFNQSKVKLLLQGQGYKIFGNNSYYDVSDDEIIINDEISKSFIETFSQFLETLPQAERKRYINNFLLFIKHTKGFENLDNKEKEMLDNLQAMK